MADLEYDIGIDARAAIGQLKKMSAELKGLRQDMQKTDKATGNASNSMGKLKVAAAAVAVAFAAFKSIKIAGEFEKLQVVLKAVTGSTKEAALAFKFVQDIAKGLPFSLQEITTAYTKMVALGIQPTREALISFANTAAATGKTLNQFVEAIADAVTGEFERLKEFGIKVRNEGDTLKLTFQGITKSIQNDAASIQKYLQDIGETQFAGAAADQMDTLNGRWSVFTDEVSKFADEFANATGLLDFAKVSLVALTIVLEEMRDSLGGVIDFIKTEIPAAFGTLGKWIGLTEGQMSSFVDTVINVFTAMGQVIKAVFTDTRHVGVKLIDGLVVGFLSLQKYWNVFVESMSFGWDKTIESIRTSFNSMINEIIEMWNKVAGVMGLESLNIDLLDVTSGTATWAERMAGVNKEFEDNVKVHKEAIALWHEDVDAQNKLKEIEKERAEIQERLDLDKHNETLKRRQEELNKQAAAAKKVVDSEKAFNAELSQNAKEGEKLAAAYRKWRAPLAEIQKREEAITLAFKEGKLSADDYKDSMAQLDMERDEASRRQLENSKKWSDGWKRAFEDYKESAMDAASHSERLFNIATAGMEDAIVDFVKTGKFEFRDLVDEILEELLRIQIRKTFAAAFSGGGGSGYAGAYDQGGYIPAGKFGIVGERGPEIVNGPANVTGREDTAAMMGGGGGTTINVSAPNVYDIEGLRRLLSQDPGFVAEVAEYGKRISGGRRR